MTLKYYVGNKYIIFFVPMTDEFFECVRSSVYTFWGEIHTRKRVNHFSYTGVKNVHLRFLF